MAGRLCERSALSPAGHAAVHQARISREAHLGPETQPLGDSRAEAFDQRIGAADQFERRLDGPRIFQIEGDGLAVAQQQVGSQRRGDPEARGLLAIDPQHRGAEIREQHRAHRPGADARELHHLDSGERSHGQRFLIASHCASLQSCIERQRRAADSLHPASPIDDDQITGDVSGLFRGEIGKQVGELAVFAESAQRDAQLLGLDLRPRRIEPLPGAFGREQTRRDRVQADAFGSPLDGEAAGHRDHAGFGRRGRDGECEPGEGGRRGDAQDDTPAARFDPALAAGDRAVERAVQHDAQESHRPRAAIAFRCAQ